MEPRGQGPQTEWPVTLAYVPAYPEPSCHAKAHQHTAFVFKCCGLMSRVDKQTASETVGGNRALPAGQGVGWLLWMGQ